MSHFEACVKANRVAERIAAGDDPADMQAETFVRLLISVWAIQWEAEEESRSA